MRRIAVLAAAALAVAGAIAGCGGSAAPAGAANKAVTATGSFGHQPKVSIPARQASSGLVIKTLIHGTGPAVTSSDAVLGNIAIYRWRGSAHQMLESTFTKNDPQLLPPDVGLTGLRQALAGQKVGSRVLAVLPPKYGYGTTGNTSIHIEGTDTTVWVVDLIKAFQPSAAAAGKTVSRGGAGLPSVSVGAHGAPTVKVPSSAAPAKLITKTLIQGSGPALVTGDTVIAQVVGVNWRTGKTFYTTWPTGSSPTGSPFSFQLGGQVISGWNKALPGVKVGSRVMLVVPPDDGYGKSGNSEAGIKGTDTLVFIVDVLDAVPAAS